MKKTLLSIGTLASVAAPLITVVACGDGYDEDLTIPTKGSLLLDPKVDLGTKKLPVAHDILATVDLSALMATEAGFTIYTNMTEDMFDELDLYIKGINKIGADNDITEMIVDQAVQLIVDYIYSISTIELGFVFLYDGSQEGVRTSFDALDIYETAGLSYEKLNEVSTLDGLIDVTTKLATIEPLQYASAVDMDLGLSLEIAKSNIIPMWASDAGYGLDTIKIDSKGTFGNPDYEEITMASTPQEIGDFYI